MGYFETGRNIGWFNGVEPAGEKRNHGQGEALVYPQVEDPVVKRIISNYLVATVGEGYEEKILEKMAQRGIIDKLELGHFRFSAEEVTQHPQSSAYYLIDERRTTEGDLIYLSVIPPNKTSSRHLHRPPVREIYYPFEGEVFLNRFSGETLVSQELLPRNGLRVVESMEVHQAQTNNNFALTAIKMTGVRGIPHDKLHERLT